MIFLTIWPLFALICLGFIMARAGFPDPGFWPAAEKVNYYILFPALLIGSLAKAPLGDPDILRLGGAACVTLGVATAALYLWRRIRPSPAARFGPTLQGVVRFNTYLGLAVTASLAGAAGMERAAIMLAVMVPLVNVLSIMALSDKSSRRGPLDLAVMMLRNPLILACLAGIALALTGAGLPYGTGQFLTLLAQASLPLGLLCVGAALRPATLKTDSLAIAANSLTRLAVMPALAALIALTFGLAGTEALVLVIFFAIPTAPTAYVLTRQCGGDGTYMAGLITAQTLAAVVTIPLVLMIFGT
ncbi:MULTISPECIES: AEC family transporter [unclassified Yoonia]|uniref:AEC family transporter n=1 Tax=unclassified Yoonia TaxID=2629118 RepID=UPI002AFEA4D7|nr:MULTISPECIES: AEC family transporter [unclassified Yoonia]